MTNLSEWQRLGVVMTASHGTPRTATSDDKVLKIMTAGSFPENNSGAASEDNSDIMWPLGSSVGSWI